MEYRINPQIGRVKHSVSFHDEVKKHQDGSKFFDLRTFRTKRAMNKFCAELISKYNLSRD